MPTTTTFLDQVMVLLTRFVQIGGGLWLVWGVIILATGLKDKNGPELKGGIWQIIGGAMIIAASTWFASTIVP